MGDVREIAERVDCPCGRCASHEAAVAIRALADENDHHVEELEIRMADITRLTAELAELRAWCADMERRERERSR